MSTTTETMTPGVEAQALASFQASTRHHELAVLRDDGLYRHLRYRGTSSSYWFDIVTWPGNLAITGDMGSYLFGRAASEDMLEFFRGKRINPGYWAEKVKAADPEGGVRRYSADAFLQSVAEEAAGYEDAFPGLTYTVNAAVTDELFNAEDEGQAREFLNDFEYRPADGDARDDAPLAFRFADPWEWDLTDFGFHYLWCCHAITWGITRYDESKAAEGQS
jgi:hypothetical protein